MHMFVFMVYDEFIYVCVCKLMLMFVNAYPFQTVRISLKWVFEHPSKYTKRIYFNSFDKQICMPE